MTFVSRFFIRFSLSFFLVFVSSSLVFAERPFLATERAFPTARGTYRLEGGLNYNRISSDSKKTISRLKLRYGLIQNLEFDLEIPFLFVDSDGKNKNRPGDVLLKTKIRFLKGRAANPLSIAGQMIIKFPTAGKSDVLDTSGVVDVGFLAIASKEFSPITTHINLGYFFIGNPAGKDLPDQIRYSLGLEAEMDHTPIKAVGEITGRADLGSSPSDDQSIAMLGFSLQTQRNLIFDTTVGFGLNKNSPDYVINGGATYFF